jgi:hypothetical protein
VCGEFPASTSQVLYDCSKILFVLDFLKLVRHVFYLLRQDCEIKEWSRNGTERARTVLIRLTTGTEGGLF